MEILYPNGSLNHLEAMEVTDTTVQGKEIPKNFCPEAQDRAQAFAYAFVNSLLNLNWSAKRQLEFPPGSTTELGRWNKEIPSVPRFASWELQVPTGSCTHSQGSEIQEKDLHNWAQLFSMGQDCLEVEGKTEGILWYFFSLKIKKVLPIYQIPGEKLCLKAWKQPKGKAVLCADTFPPTGTHHSTAPCSSQSLPPARTASSWQGINIKSIFKSFLKNLPAKFPGKVGNLSAPWAWLLCFLLCYMCPNLDETSWDWDRKAPKLSPFQCQSWERYLHEFGEHYGMPDTQSWYETEVTQKSLSNLFTLNSTQGGQSCRWWKPTATRPLPGKAPYHETAHSSHLLSNPTEQEEKSGFHRWNKQEFAPRFLQALRKQRLIFHQLRSADHQSVGCSTNRPLSLNNSLKPGLQNQAEKPSKSKGFLQIEAD